jgi:hypothetical protein
MRHAHAAVSYGGKMYIFGGYPGAWGSSAQNDMWMFDPAINAWELVIAVSGDVPAPRGVSRRELLVLRKRATGKHLHPQPSFSACVFPFRSRSAPYLGISGSLPAAHHQMTCCTTTRTCLASPG